ncbi:putative Zn-dependent hydrolase of beta-lactamase [Acidovorax sp. CF316]|uniref:metal-dependent hydrolase n=1 Tax=Acidovorax sp. CF316 TaxID=1144317 RepID=UPI00026BE7DD|nr:metal-dependent hydrolase [Acidovorax sp. CF316]EJE50528.1 putative Zn-dependent hydrolase of beta-lactamase [Acidovorax sp. CF316]
MRQGIRLLLKAVVIALVLPYGCATSVGSSGSADLHKAGNVEVLWLGQSAFRIKTPSGKVIVTDPWLIQNPLTPAKYKDLAALGKIDVLLVTHAHADHFADAPALAKLNNVPMYAPGDMNQTVGLLGILPPALAPRFNKSGTVTPVEGIKVTAVHAEHSSILVWKNPVTEKDEPHAAGEPVGFIIELENGFRIYHMGDTGLFSDMKFIAEYYKPDLVLMPIGGHFTMGPEDAAYATREWLRPRFVIPMHYGANPLGKGRPEDFIKAIGESRTRVLPLKPGEAATF